MTSPPLELEAGDWQLRAWAESRFEFTPGRPITYWVIRYRPHKAADWLPTMLEHVGQSLPAQAELWQAARDDYAERKGIAAA